MKSLKIISYTKDLRTNTNVVYAQINIVEYTKLVGDDFDRFGIQRKKEKHKGYNRLKRDLEQGALIPTITLAIEPSVVDKYIPLAEKKESQKIIELLASDADNIYILDGLQRTYIIKDILDSGKEFPKDHSLLLELWLETDIKHLIYRLIVLNSGQKPMSMRHQLELLFMTMKSSLERDIKGLELFLEKDEEKRTRPNQFAFDKIVLSYKAFLTKSTEIDKDNVVSEQLIEDEILDSEEDILSSSFYSFKEYLDIYCDIDKLVFDKYANSSLKKYRNWTAEINVMISFFSAASRFYADEKRKAMLDKALNSLLQDMHAKEDPLYLEIFSSLKDEKANPKKYNVGYATRRLLNNGFIEFFRGYGEERLADCWSIAASEL